MLHIPAPGQRFHHTLSGAPREEAFETLAAGAKGAAVGWLPARRGLLGNLRVWENIVLGAAHHGRAVDKALEALLLQWLGQVGYDAEASATLLGAVVEALDARAVRLACVLRTLAARPQLVLVQSEWFGRLAHDENEQYLALFDQHLPAAAWLSIGQSAPPAAWRFAVDPPAHQAIAEESPHVVAR